MSHAASRLGARCRHERGRRRSHGGDAYPDLP